MKFNHSAHIRLWDWLSKNPDKRKKDWPEWQANGGNVARVSGDCFACEYTMKCNYCSCSNCPLIWPNNISCNRLGGLFIRWNGAVGNEKQALAEQIRDLPVKEGVECK